MFFCAGIVSYNPDIDRLQANIEAILPQVDHIYIFDNQSNNIKDLQTLVNQKQGVSLIEHGHNSGIAKALNCLCERASLEGFRWMLTLDQDSVCPPDLISKMSNYLDEDKIGIVCPAIHYDGRKAPNHTIEAEEVSACMTSASLTNLKAWERVGGFAEEYFIDFVDNEFCMKLRQNAYKIMRINTIALDHQLGTFKHRTLLGFIPLRASMHAPFRLYYMTRNNLMFIKTYKKNLNLCKEFLKLYYIITVNLLIADDRIKTWKYICLGFKDYRKGRTGECLTTY